MSEPQYTAKDPHYEVICLGCRYGRHYDHDKAVNITDGVLKGNYKCACIRCRRD